jgi:hypothetical protein
MSIGLAAAALAAMPGPATAAPVAPVAPVAATTSACKDVPEAETHLAVLMSSADVLSVREIRANERLDESTIALGNGARIVLAARPFANSAWLESVIACHLARNAAQGKVSHASSSPLDVEGIVVVVTGWTPGELAVDITSPRTDRAEEILTRARGLLPRGRAQAAR